MKFPLTLVSQNCKIQFRVSDLCKLFPTLKIKPFFSSFALKHKGAAASFALKHLLE